MNDLEYKSLSSSFCDVPFLVSDKAKRLPSGQAQGLTSKDQLWWRTSEITAHNPYVHLMACSIGPSIPGSHSARIRKQRTMGRDHLGIALGEQVGMSVERQAYRLAGVLVPPTAVGNRDEPDHRDYPVVRIPALAMVRHRRSFLEDVATEE
jgi:hypothetical protein